MTRPIDLIVIMLVLLFLTVATAWQAAGQSLNGDLVRLRPTTVPSVCNTGDIRIDAGDSNKLKVCSSNTWGEAGFANPMTANGDIITQTAGIPARLAIGSANTVLTSSGSAAAWAKLLDANLDTAAAINATKIADGSVTSAEFQFIGTLSSNAQTQLDGKASTTLNNLGTTAVNADLNMAASRSVVLKNSVTLKSRNAADDASIDLISADADGETLVSGKEYDIGGIVNNVWWGDTSGGFVGISEGHYTETMLIGTREHASNSTVSPTAVLLATGNKAGAGAEGSTGAVLFHTGDSAGTDAGNTGNIYGETGALTAATSATTGTVEFKTGRATSGTSATGNVKFTTGNSTGGSSGSVSFTVGTAGGTQGSLIFLKSGVSPAIGNAFLATGTNGAGYWGELDLADGDATTGVLPIANGGTGQDTAQEAIDALVPSQTGNSGEYLTTDGTNTSWAAAPTSDVINAAAAVTRVESADLDCDASSAIVSQLGTWVASIGNVSGGACAVTLTAGIFSATPICFCQIYGSVGSLYTDSSVNIVCKATSTTAAIVDCEVDGGAGDCTDYEINLLCVGAD